MSNCEVNAFAKMCYTCNYFLKGERSSRSLFLPNLRNLIVMVTSSAYRVNYTFCCCASPFCFDNLGSCGSTSSSNDQSVLLTVQGYKVFLGSSHDGTKC